MDVYLLENNPKIIIKSKLKNLDYNNLSYKNYDSLQSISLDLYDILQNPVDFKYSNYSGFVLTQNKLYENIIKSGKIIDALDYVKTTTISINTSYGNYKIYNGNVFSVIILDKNASIMALKDYAGNYLTYDGTNNPEFSPLNSNYVNQKFYYSKSDNKFLIYEYGVYNSTKKALACNTTSFSAVDLSSLPSALSPDDYTIEYTFDDFIDYSTDYNNNESYAYYDTGLSSNGQNQNIEKLSSNITRPYLTSFEYYEPIGNIYDTNLLPLKNTQSSDSKFLNGKIQRDYSNISIIDNALNGNSEIILGYNVYDCGSITFNQGLNYFSTYIDAANCTINNSNLKECGSIAGETPEFSDRIYLLKDSNLISNSKLDGLYQYTWLSGNSLSSIWIDRFNSLSVSGSSSKSFSDKISNTKLLPTNQYVYYRQTDENIVKYLTLLDNYSSYKVNEYNILNVNGYDSDKNYEKDVFTGENIYVLNGTNHARLDNISLSGDFSITFNLYQENWNSPSGTMIIGNYFNDSGLGLFFNTVVTPFIGMAHKNSVKYYNSNGILIQKINFPTNTANSITDYSILTVAHTINDCYWLVTENDAYKFDMAGMVVDYLALSSVGAGEEIKEFYCDSVGDIYIKDVVNDIYKVDAVSKESTLEVENIGGSLCIDKNDELQYYSLSSVTKVEVDNNNNPYRIQNGYLYSNSLKIFDFEIQDFCFDKDNNLWIIKDNILQIYDNSMVNTFEYTCKDLNGISSLDRKVGILQKNNDNLGVILSKSNNNKKVQIDIVQIVDNTLTSIKTVINSDNNATLYNDFTGFAYKNKFKPSSSITLKANFAYEKDFTENDNVTIIGNISPNLDSGYHLFCISYSKLTGEFKLDIDSHTFYSYKFLPDTMVLSNKYNNPFIIGTYLSKNQSLQKMTDIYDSYNLYGKIKGVNFYNISLNKIQQKFLIKKYYSVPSMDWIVPSQKRIMCEKIDTFFKNKIPGNKSTMFNLNINNSGITNTTVMENIQNNITTLLENNIPVNSSILNFNWK